MMDAVSYLTNLSRLCDYYTSREMCGNSCPVVDYCNAGNDITAEDAKESVAAVEKWSKGHPIKSNGDKLVDFVEENGGHFFGCHTGNGVITISTSLDWWDAEYKGV